MQNRQHDRRINGAALEMIMQDVLTGMQDFTLDACTGCVTANMEILAVEAADSSVIRSAEVLPFPPRRSDNLPD